MINIKNINLESFDSSDIRHFLAKKELTTDSSSEFVHQIDERLILNKDNKFGFEKGYLVSLNKEIVGYLYISSFFNQKVYLEYSIIKEYRKKGLGKLLLSEITDYLCDNYNIKEIILNIDISNLASMNLASSVGYYFDPEKLNKNNSDNKQDFSYYNIKYINKKK